MISLASAHGGDVVGSQALRPGPGHSRRDRGRRKRRIMRPQSHGLDPSQLVADMKAAGAIFYIHADESRRNFRFAYHLRAGADRMRCQSLVQEAKADEELYAIFKVEVFAAILREAAGL